MPTITMEEMRSPQTKDFLQAAAQGDLETVKTFIAQGINVNVTNILGENALSNAARGNHTSIVETLLKAGANPNCTGFACKDPLTTAVRNNNPGMAQLLLAASANPNQPDTWGKTPLIYAIEQSRTDMINLLLTSGADINAHTGKQTALMVAATTGYRDSNHNVKLLLEHHADVNQPCQNGETPLMAAAQMGNVEAISLFLAAGADANATTPHDPCSHILM